MSRRLCRSDSGARTWPARGADAARASRTANRNLFIEPSVCWKREYRRFSPAGDRLKSPAVPSDLRSVPAAFRVLMSMMKRAAVLAAIFLSGSLAAFADTRSDPPFANPLLDDVVEMTRADIPDTTILAFLRVRRARLEADVTAEDLIALRRAGVHAEIVEYIA